MAFDLNPVAVTAAPLLRAIAAENWNTRTELAEAAGRKPSNIARDIAILVNAALVEERAKGDCGKPIVLTEEGVAQLAGLDRANGSGSAGALTALHSDIGPHPLNPRKDFETAEAEEGLDELRVSIVKKGLLQPIVVRPQPEAGKWWIVAGERRWRAIGQAISDGDWNDDQPIEIAVREVDDREHLLLALNENLQRSNMKAIEEGVAFAAAVHDFGLSTEELSNQTGKSQRYVQQRIALLKLSQPDQDRMRLPKDHPDYLSFKAARAMTQTAREVPVHIGVDLSSGPDLTAEVEVTRAEDGTASFEVVSREPGSSDAAEAAKFGRTLTDREALAFVEIVHKAERHPATDAALAAEGYTEVADARDATRDNLVQKGLIAIRYRGSETPHARAYLMTSGAKAWLEEIGFYQHRDDVLFELRIRVHGVNAAEQHRADGTYATRWLTPAAPSPQQSPEAPQREPEQRALIEETIEERQARQAAERERAAVAQDREFASRLSDEVMRALAEARSGSKPFGDALSGDGSNEGLAALVATAFGALAAGEPELAAAAIAQLMVKGGAMGARYALQGRTLPEIERMMVAGRLAKRNPNRGSAAEELEPDPIEDFVEAEVEEGEDDAGGVATNGPNYAPQPGDPAVPIRKSITPDFIVCLEDGRKFKSLKRHLRTRYNLSPEEYRAKWGLPADYPMVAPNYAKARADLARQMGLEPAA